jgi:hypothetical protein
MLRLEGPEVPRTFLGSRFPEVRRNCCLAFIFTKLFLIAQEPSKGWYDGTGIAFAIILVLVVGCKPIDSDALEFLVVLIVNLPE